MSQAGYTPIQLYHSTTASAAPSAGNLAAGELAVNITDGKLYYKDNGGVVQVLATKAGASGDVVGPGSSTDNALVRFDGTTGKLVQSSVGILDDSGNLTGLAAVTMSGALTLSGGTANGVAYLNGSKVLTTGSALTFDGSTFGTTAPLVDVNGVSSWPTLRFRSSNNTSTTFVVGRESGASFFTNSGNSPFYWSIDGSEQMRLTSTGLGIGTSSPGAKLQVQGLIRTSSSASGIQIDRRDTSVSAYTLYSSAGNLQFYNGTSDVAVLDTSGNLGLGVTPSAWASGKTAIEMPGGTSLSQSNGYTQLTNNAYLATGGWTYKATGQAALYNQYQGQHLWYTAPSGTAGNAISFTQAMTLDASGSLGLGTTSPTARFDCYGPSDVYMCLRTGSAEMTFNTGTGFTGSTATSLWNKSAIPMVFGTNGTERARIDSSGNLLVGTTDSGQSTGVGIKLINSTTLPVVRVVTNTSNSADAGFVFSNTNATNNGFRFYVTANGGIYNYSGNNVNLSDRREKTNFAPAGEYLSKICAIPVQTFNYVGQSEDDPGTTLGVVAQDVQAVAPELVKESNWGTEEKPKMRLSIYQTDLQYALMKCIQEQQAIIEQLKADVAALKGA